MAHPATRTALTALGVVGAVGVAAATWGIGIERHLYTVRRHTLRILPAGAPPLRVLHVSDVHMAPWQIRRQEWLASLADLEPDVIVNTGDNIGHPDGLTGIRAAFDGFRGIPGFFVHGSNDRVEPSPRNPFLYFQGPSKVRHTPLNIDTAAMDAYFAELGWADLNNTTASIEAKGVRINAFGVSDAHRDWDELDALPPLVSEFGEGLVWGVTHAPYRRVLDEYVDLGAQVIFAGHTHGGQVRIPFDRRALAANLFLEPRRRAGRRPRRFHEHEHAHEHGPVLQAAANLPTHRTIVVVDVVSFTRPDRDNTDQLAIREAMYETLRAAFEDSGIPWRHCVHEDRGDGVLIFVPAEVSKVLLLGAAPARLAELLDAGNVERPPRQRFRLRMVVHAGEVHRDLHGFAGYDVNLAFRLVDAGPLRAAMDDNQAALGLIVSDSVYQGVVRHGYDGLDPRAYQRVRVQVKTADAAGWIRLVGADVPIPAVPRPRTSRGTIAVLLSDDSAAIEDLRRLGIEAVVLVRGPEDLASIARLPIYIEGELIE